MLAHVVSLHYVNNMSNISPIPFFLHFQVHVATINLKPTFEYVTVPKVAQHAFLKAKVTNSSSYAFLSGPANVFLDQSYVTETTLGSTAPLEDFSCSLGASLSFVFVFFFFYFLIYFPVRGGSFSESFVQANQAVSGGKWHSV